ncbi:hypothetical protein GNX18_00970 [Microbulbifer sp. SH-1]|uniref:cytochrome c3 family protein n=1 Tax=Microbulbifer sp. SH-1 TaxID=2681547 RepID=UPI0014090A95|nr:cytochrome c3 family protein [Microbulbifer sp. SH-1]QIL88499.1 hypothetical protein GNX18_00970 [Microbulbifer sp. SH-1]
MKNYKFKFWHYGLVVTLIVAALITYNLEASDKSFFLSGETSHGHHQIELACTTCHGDGFAGQDFMQQACLNCHAEELVQANDSHPRTKFLDPRNAGLLAHLDARLCVSCHTEHKPEITHEMGVTLAGDFCVHCHSDIAENRPSHAGFGFDTCASAGCHNYHDNRFLYEDFLAERINTPDLLANAQLPLRTLVSEWQKTHPDSRPLSAHDMDMEIESVAPETLTGIQHAWADSTHALTNTNCSSCHVDNQTEFTSAEIVTMCGGCHTEQRETFTQGKHGLRFSSQLPEEFRRTVGAMSPVAAQIAMQPAASTELSCTSCHGAHELDMRFAAVEACLGCHDDEHSRNYRASAHFKAWQSDATEGVSCAGCHLPREENNGRIAINHNQNHNLQPNEKMLPVCLSCHGVEFSVAALADEHQLKSNFRSPVSKGHDTFNLIRDRIARIKTNK